MNTFMESWPRRHRITVDEYYRMAEVGLLAPDARVELIDGEIIDMAPIGNDHASVVDQLVYRFSRILGDRAILRAQGAVLLDNYSMPQPDLMLLAWREDFYRHAHPKPADILLAVEVSDSTLRYDRDTKAPLYARHGIPEYWIVDLQHDELRVYRLPQDGQYTEQVVLKKPATVVPASLPGAGIDFTQVFGR
jgi:Uma2 family endonuclease